MKKIKTLQNHIGDIHKAYGNLKSVSFQSFEGFSILKIILPQMVIVFCFIGVLFSNEIIKKHLSLNIFFFNDFKYHLSEVHFFTSIIFICLLYLYYELRKKAYKHIIQQKKYYKWGKVKEPSIQQLQALQLVAFARYNEGFWTDTLEVQPVEVRVKHIKNFSKKLNCFIIRTKEEEVKPWADYWGIASKEQYEKLYNKLINGLHTTSFLISYQKHPSWKNKLLELTDLPESYFNSCFISERGKAQKNIWAWDLWLAIVISSGAFMCGFITEDEAWQKIYKVSDISHFLFDSLEDFLKNFRLGHAYWCNNKKVVLDRKKQIDIYLNPKTSTMRKTHSVPWVKPETVHFPKNMLDSLQN